MIHGSLIAAGGLGVGGIGVLVARGLGRSRFPFGGGGTSPRAREPLPGALDPARQDDADLIEILPAIIGALNANQAH